MAYVAVRGGREAIENAEQYLRYQRDAGPTPPLQVAQVAARLHLAVDRVMGEGSLYAPDLAALALIQSAGDTFEAAFALRAHRATLPRVATSLAEGTTSMRVIRRISSAFKEIPGGQILGPTPDYTLRLLDFSLVEEDPAARAARLEAFVRTAGSAAPAPDTFPKMIDILRAENLLADKAPAPDEAPFDVTREALRFPAPRYHLGYGLCFGHNETKAISMAVLDRALCQRGSAPSRERRVRPLARGRHRGHGIRGPLQAPALRHLPIVARSHEKHAGAACRRVSGPPDEGSKREIRRAILKAVTIKIEAIPVAIRLTL